MAALGLLIGSLLVKAAKCSQTYHNASNGECGFFCDRKLEPCTAEHFIYHSHLPWDWLESFVFSSQNPVHLEVPMALGITDLMAVELHHVLITNL